MTSTTIPPRTDSSPLWEPNLRTRARRAVQDTNTVLWRDTIRTMRQPDMLAFAGYTPGALHHES